MNSPEYIIYLEKLGIRKARECWICEYASKFDFVKVADIVIPQKPKVDKSTTTKVRVKKKIANVPSFEEPHCSENDYIFSNDVSKARDSQWEILDSSDDPDTYFVNEDERQQKVVSDIRASVDDSMSQDDLKTMLIQSLDMKRYNIIWSALEARITIVWRESVKNRMRNFPMCPS